MWRSLLRSWRWLRSEIVLGFLIATVFWIGVLGWQSADAPTDAQKQKCYEAAQKSGHRPEDCKTLWQRTTSDPVAFFTLWLVIFTSGLTISTVMLWRAGEKQSQHTRRSAAIQTRDMHESIAVAAKAADAAMLSARAAIALQLPVFRIIPDHLGWGDTKTGEDTIRTYCNVNAVRFQNIGQTRAIPIELRYGFTLGGVLPPVPCYQFAERFLPENIFEADPKITPMKRLNGDIAMMPDDWSLICTGAKDVWFYCEFTFEDFMESRHDVSFCWKWTYTGSGMTWRRDRTPAYNRKT